MTFDGRYINGSQPQAGTVDVTVTSGSGSTSITFKAPFDSPPVVTPAAALGGWIATPANITATGCNINVVHRISTANTTVPVQWIAMAATQ